MTAEERYAAVNGVIKQLHALQDTEESVRQRKREATAFHDHPDATPQDKVAAIHAIQDMMREEDTLREQKRALQAQLTELGVLVVQASSVESDGKNVTVHVPVIKMKGEAKQE